MNTKFIQDLKHKDYTKHYEVVIQNNDNVYIGYFEYSSYSEIVIEMQCSNISYLENGISDNEFKILKINTITIKRKYDANNIELYNYNEELSITPLNIVLELYIKKNISKTEYALTKNCYINDGGVINCIQAFNAMLTYNRQIEKIDKNVEIDIYDMAETCINDKIKVIIMEYFDCIKLLQQ